MTRGTALFWILVTLLFGTSAFFAVRVREMQLGAGRVEGSAAVLDPDAEPAP